MSQKAVETKRLSPRLPGEWFGIPNTTVYLHVAKNYAKFGAGRLVVSEPDPRMHAEKEGLVNLHT